MKKILVIEDNQQVRENVEEILELADYSVLTAPNGKKGVEIAIESMPDLIICDIMMPVLDGYGVLHLLNMNPATFGIPFIFLTAKSEKSDLRKGMEMGADDYLTKPFDGIELLKAVEIRLKKSAILKNESGTRENVQQFLNNVQENGIAKLVSSDRELYDFRKKQILYQEGTRPKAIYYILHGKVKIYKSSNDGKEFITQILGPTDFLGYLPVLQHLNYTETAEVMEDAQIMLIPIEDFLTLLTCDASVSAEFIKLISKNMMKSQEQLVNLAYNSLRRKVAYGLLQVYENYHKENGTNEIPLVSREDLARVCGVATESLIRTLADFKSEKLIDLKPGRILVLDEKKLKDLPF